MTYSQTINEAAKAIAPFGQPWDGIDAASVARMRLQNRFQTGLDIAGEFGAVSVVSGHIRGETNTMPLHVEILYNEYNFAAAFAVASLLALLALVTLVIKITLEWRYADQIAASRRH